MAKKEAAPAAEGQPAGKSKLKLIILIVVGLLLAVGLSVGGTWFILSKGDKSEEHAASEAEAPPGARRADDLRLRREHLAQGALPNDCIRAGTWWGAAAVPASESLCM